MSDELAALEARLTKRMDDGDNRLMQRMDEIAASIEESIRDAQTEILRAVFTAQEGNTARLSDLEHTDASLKERMAVMERRLSEIEKKLHLAN